MVSTDPRSHPPDVKSSFIQAALGEIPLDLVLSGGNVVDVYSGTTFEADVAVYRDRIVGIGRYDGVACKRRLDVSGRYLIPGLIDAHMHIESTMLTPQALAEILVPRGVTTILADPHEIANVMGVKGIQLLLSMAEEAPLRVFVQVPSRVPTAPGLEDSGASLGIAETQTLLSLEGAVSLGELNFQHVLSLGREYLEKISLAESSSKLTNGHMPGLLGRELNACLAAGLRDDHECVTQEEALERLRRGCAVMVREGTSERNLEDILAGMEGKIADTRGLLFCTDDKHPSDILREGHIDFNVRKAIEIGIDPIKALQMATINTATHFRLDHEIGVLAPGRKADVVVVENLRTLQVSTVVFDGRVVYREGMMLYSAKTPEVPEWALKTVRVSPDLSKEDLMIKVPDGTSEALVRVINVIPGQIINRETREWVKVKDGFLASDPSRDLLHIAVVDRHRATKQVGRAFVRGFGLIEGAIASSVAHDHHNIVVVGVDLEDMLRAVSRLAEIGGGFVAVRSGGVIAELPLPLGGLISLSSASEVVNSLDRLSETVRLELGCSLDSPFMQLEFVTLPTVPDLGITNKGLVDARRFELVDPIVTTR